MFLKKTKKKSLSQSIAVRFTIILFITNLFIVIIMFFLLRSELSKKDKELAYTHYHEVSEVIENNGVDFLKIQTEKEEFNDLDDLVIVIKDNIGRILLEHLPKKMDNFEMSDVNHKLIEASRKDGFYTVDSQQLFQETLELYSGQTLSYRLIVGINTDASEDFVNLYFKLAVILNLLAGLFSIAIGYYFSHKSLKPIRDLIHAVKQIRSGDMHTSLALKNRNDELSELTFLFDDMIKQINKLISSLQSSLDAISHDLRTPLTHITNKLELHIRHSDSTNSKELFGELLEEAQSLSTLVNHLLEITQTETKAFDLKKEQINLLDLFNECIEIYEFIIEEKHAKVFVNCENNIHIFADRNKLKRVIANLLDNALKYHSQTPEISFDCAQEKDVIVLSCKDNGPGINVDDKNKIWQRLYRGDLSRSTPGMGLGLSFVKSIVEAHGWSIEMTDHHPTGTIFTIKIQNETSNRSLK